MNRTAMIAAMIALGSLSPAAQAQGAPITENRMIMMHDVDAPLLSFAIIEEMKTAPDRASISTGVQTQATTAVEAMRLNAQAMERMITALRRARIAERDIQTSGFNLSPQYDYRPQEQGQPPRLTGYQVSNQLTVVTADLARLGALLDTLVEAGGTNISGPNFFVAEPDAMLDSAREAALRRAGERANRYARAAGYARARLVSVNEGGGFVAPPPMPMMRMEVAMAADAASTQVQAGQVSNSVMLSVQYRLER